MFQWKPLDYYAHPSVGIISLGAIKPPLTEGEFPKEWQALTDDTQDELLEGWMKPILIACRETGYERLVVKDLSPMASLSGVSDYDWTVDSILRLDGTFALSDEENNFGFYLHDGWSGCTISRRVCNHLGPYGPVI